MRSSASRRGRATGAASVAHDPHACLPGRPDPSRAALRNQLAVVRALMDEVARLQPLAGCGAPSAQLVEELARLGCRCFEAAEATSRFVDPDGEATPAPASHVRERLGRVVS